MASYEGYFNIESSVAGGPDGDIAVATLTISDGYASISECTLGFSFDVSGSYIPDSCSVVVTKNDSPLTTGTIYLNNLTNGEIYIGLSGGTFKSRDEIKITISAASSLNGWIINEAAIFSNNATISNPITPGVPGNALKRKSSGYPLYYDGYVVVTNAYELTDIEVYIPEEDWTTYYETGFWWGGDSSYGDIRINDIWFMKAVLSTYQNLETTPRKIMYTDGCSYYIPGKVYITIE